MPSSSYVHKSLSNKYIYFIIVFIYVFICFDDLHGPGVVVHTRKFINSNDCHL